MTNISDNTTFYKSDFNNKKLGSYLDEISSYLINSANKIDAYCENANVVLEGPAFEIIKTRLKMYGTLYRSFGESLSNIESSIVTCNNKVSNAMGSNDSLFGKKLNELEKKVNAAYSYLCSFKESADDFDKNKFIVAKSNYSSAKREYDSYKRLLESTMSADKKGLSLTDDVNSIMNKINSEINYQGSMFN